MVDVINLQSDINAIFVSLSRNETYAHSLRLLLTCSCESVYHLDGDFEQLISSARF